MLNRYFIIDDFYTHPDELVEVALDSLSGKVLRGNFAGVMTSRTFLSPEHRELFQTLLHEPVIDSATELNGKIRFSQASEPYTQNIHFDGGRRTKWSGVVYLSKDHPAVDGTIFWKHRRTGLEEIPRTTEGLAKHGWSTYEELKSFLEKDGTDDSLWEKTLTIPYRYNRLVLFRPWLFHSPGRAFGETLRSSRMVQTLFLGH